MKRYHTNGFLVYDGPSAFDGKPVVAILTGVTERSNNVATGGMAQLWILPRDVEPHTSVDKGTDCTQCGTCPHKGVEGGGDGLCYVVAFQAPLAVWRAYHRQNYTPLPLDVAVAICRALGVSIRWGAYGDVGALPLELRTMAADLSRKGDTGYTHAWRNCPELSPGFMASCDSSADYQDAHAAGFRTFRTSETGETLPGEIRCLKDREDTHATCDRCGLCGGSKVRAKSIVIKLHGNKANKYLRLKGA